MPFHYRLLGRDRYAMFSFVQSMNTTFGISVWEQIVTILARKNWQKASRQYKLLGNIDPLTEKIISQIHYNLRKGVTKANQIKEFKEIRKSIKPGKPLADPDSTVDFFVSNNEENYFDITSAKPNIKEFVALKLKLLRWVALRLSQSKKVHVFARLAIPYNPYHPQP